MRHLPHLPSISYMRMNDKENNAMVRDFSGEAKQELLQYVDSIISKQRWEEIANTIVFYNVSIPVIVSRLGIKECIDSVGNYYSNLINKNKATKRQIEEIFANVQSIDTKYMGKLSQYINTGNLWVKYIDDLSGLIDPNGGNLDIKKYKAILDADKEKLNAANMSVVKTLVSDGKVDEATDYVDVVDNLDLTYDEFMALSDEEKMAYLSGTSNWLTTLYPNVEMEEGIYEITVPLGVDMSATYNVTVSGSVETDSSETINVTIDQQQIVLANAQKFEIDNMSLSLDRDEAKIEDKFGSGKFAFGYNKDEKIFLNSVIKNGESEMKYGASIDVSSISIQCKVTTQLEQNLAVTSSVKLEKSNNVDMKNWSAVRVEEEKENLDQVYWEMDPLYRESSMKKAEIFIAFHLNIGYTDIVSGTRAGFLYDSILIMPLFFCTLLK